VTMSVLIMWSSISPRPSRKMLPCGENSNEAAGPTYTRLHLIIGPIAGAISGGIGGVILRFRGKQEQRPAV
jgi:hypothetical protein